MKYTNILEFKVRENEVMKIEGIRCQNNTGSEKIYLNIEDIFDYFDIIDNLNCKYVILPEVKDYEYPIIIENIQKMNINLRKMRFIKNYDPFKIIIDNEGQHLFLELSEFKKFLNEFGDNIPASAVINSVDFIANTKKEFIYKNGHYLSYQNFIINNYKFEDFYLKNIKNNGNFPYWSCSYYTIYNYLSFTGVIKDINQRNFFEETFKEYYNKYSKYNFLKRNITRF